MKLGRVVRVLYDDSRKEIFSADKENRKVVISIFYQADKDVFFEKKAYYKDLYEPNKEEFIKRFGDNSEEKNRYLNNIEINTFNDAPMIKEDRKYPVILYSGGLGMGRDLYMFNIEALVAKGYIVITIEHIYDSEFTVLPDGKVIEQDKNIENDSKKVIKEIINTRREDILFILEQLKNLNREDEVVRNKMDLNKIGAIGHSLGAYTLFESFTKDERIKALVMLDGSLQYIDLNSEILEGKNLNKPLLNFRKGLNKYEERMKFFIERNENKLDGEKFKKLIISQHYTVIKQEEGQDQLAQYLGNYQSSIKLNKTEHMTFSDWFIIKNQCEDNDMLSIEEAHCIINDVTISFLDEFLCGINEEYTNILKNSRYSDLTLLDS